MLFTLAFEKLNPGIAALGVTCAAVGAWIAWHHPLSASVALGVFLALVAWAWARPAAGLWLVPAALPLIGLAPWTGWLTFEEFDLLILSLGGAALASNRWRSVLQESPAGQRRRPPSEGASALVLFTVLLFAASALCAMWRGFGDAGGFSFGWFQGYHEPMNSLRLAKSFFLALLLWRVWCMASSEAPRLADGRWAWGMTLGLVAVSMVAVWERAAYTGLLNFTSDYRTTALFWEMHVGGAALDGFLALSVPFALNEFLQEQSRRRWWLAAVALLLAAYVCLTTFSRGVYLAVPLAVALTYLLQRKQGAVLRLQQGVADQPAHVMLPLGLLLVFTACAAWMFPSSGYRGMLALLGGFGLLIVLAPQLHRLKLLQWLKSICGALVLGGLAWTLSNALDKGAYVAYAVAATFTAFAAAWSLWAAQLHSSKRLDSILGWGVRGLLLTWIAILLVALHWGGEAAAWRSLGPVCVLVVLLVLAGRWRGQHWPQRWRGQFSLLGGLAICAAVVGVLLGGSYMSERFSTGGKDMQGRLLHWQVGLNALTSPLDWALGKGQGRFPASHFHSGLTEDQTGDYRMLAENGNNHLVMSSGKHLLGWGEMLRLSQRVSPPTGPSTVTFDACAASPLVLHFEVCEKHLLYSGTCVIKEVQIQADANNWQHHSVPLQGDIVPSRGHWVAPKLLMFSVAIATNASVAKLDNLQLTDASGTNLLRNGDFAEDLSGWFFTSDRHHMPWHIKSMFMHVLFDQGVIGLLLWLALSLGALWRVSLGTAKSHPLAPAIAGALVGFAVVGLFDSLLDVPRIAILYYVLVLMGLTVRAAERPVGTAAASSQRKTGS